MKFYKTIFFVLISFILIGCQSKSNEDLVNRTIIEPETKQEKKSETKEVKIKDYPRDTTPGEVITITMAQLEEKIANKETFVVSFETTYCMYCRRLHSILDDYLKDHHVSIYQVVLDLENATEEENLEKIHKHFEEFYTTPGVFYVKKGKNKSYLDTYTLGIEEDVIDQWIREKHIDKKKS